MAKKYGWKKFKSMWEYEANMITQGHRPEKTDPYDDNPYELEAEEFGQKNWKVSVFFQGQKLSDFEKSDF